MRPSLRERLPAPTPEAPAQPSLPVDRGRFGLPPVVSRAAAIRLEERGSTAPFWGIFIIVITSLVWLSSMAVGFQTALTIQMGIGLVLAVAGLFSPSLGLLSIGMLAALDAIAAEYILTGGLLRFNTVNYWLLIVMLVYLPFILRLRDVNSRTLQLFILVLALYLMFSSNLSEGVQDVFNIATTFGLVVYFALSLKDKLSLYWLGLTNGVLAGLGGLLFLLQIDQLPYANPNNWTFFQLTALFSICISFNYANEHRKSKLILMFLAVINTAWIFLSGSRGSLLIALLCIVYLFLSTRSITWSSIMIALSILVGLWVSTQFVEQQVNTVSRIQLLFNPNESERRRTSQRSELVRVGWEIFLDNPLGIGTGSFREVTAESAFFSSRKPAHSAWIKTLAENGIPGIILMTTFVISFALAGFRKHREGRLLFGLFITAVFVFAFIAKEFSGKSLWFLAAGGIVLLRPAQMLAHLERKIKPGFVDPRRRLREVRFGRK